MAKAIEEVGHQAAVYTFYTSRDMLENGVRLISPDYAPRILSREVAGLRYRLMDKLYPGRFVRLKRLLLLKYFLEEEKNLLAEYDLFIDAGSNIPLSGAVSYIHYPALAKEYGSAEQKGLAYRAYLRFFYWYAQRFVGNPLAVFTNSSWTAVKIVETHLSLRGRVSVLHPPVDVEFFSEVASGEDRERLVVTVSRFTPEKGLDKIIDVAKSMPEYRFVIAGSKAGYSEPVIRRLRERISEENVANVELLINVPRRELRDLLGRAKYYLHPPFPEHFGIAIAEAMAAGCIPIVYRDGGGWTDLASHVHPGLGYMDIAEIPAIIERIDSDKQLYQKLRQKAVEHSAKYSYKYFKQKLAEYLENLAQASKHQPVRPHLF